MTSSKPFARRALILAACAAVGGIHALRASAGITFNSGSSTSSLFFDPDTGGGSTSKTVNVNAPPNSTSMPAPSSYHLNQTYPSGSATSTAKGSIGYVANATTATFTLSSGTGVTQTDPSNIYTGDSLLRVNFDGYFDPTSPQFGPVATGYVSIAVAGIVGTGGHAQFIGQVNFRNPNNNTNLRPQVNFNQLFTTVGSFSQTFTSSSPLNSPNLFIPLGTPVRVFGFFEFRASNADEPSDIAPADMEFGNAPPTATWYADANNTNWTDAPNWSAPATAVIEDLGGFIPAVPNGIGQRARFLSNLTAPRQITLNAPITLGALDTATSATGGITINGVGGNKLTMDAQTGDSSIEIRNIHGTNEQSLNTELVLNDTVDINTVGTYQGYGQPKPVGNLLLNEPISGAGALGKRGEGVVALSAPNTYLGGTLAQGGNLVANVTGSLSSGAVHADDGMVSYNAAHAAKTGIAVTADNNGQIALGIFSDAQEKFVIGDLGCISGATDPLLALTVGGNLTISPGAMIGHRDFQTGTAGNPTGIGAIPNYVFGISNDFPTTGTPQVVQVGSNSNGPWRGFGSDRVDRLFGSNPDIATDRVEVFGAAELVTLHETLMMNGRIISIGPGASLVKRGGGTSILSNVANAFNGPINVGQGTLLVNGEFVPQPLLSMTVQSGATFGGSGYFNGPVTAQAGSTIAPGTNILNGYAGTLHVGSLNLDPETILDFDLSDPGMVGQGFNDLIVIDGSLVLDGILNIHDLGSFDGGQYTLMQFSGALTDHGLLLGNLPSDAFAYSLAVNVGAGGIGGTVVLNTVAVVPEPASLLGVAVLLPFMRRRRAR